MSTSTAPKVRLERDGAVGRLTLCSPPLNLFDQEVAEGLMAAVAEVAADPELRALVVRADGDVFSAGVRVEDFRGRTGDDGVEETLTERLVHPLEDLPIPTLAVVGGLCLTAGFELCLACDLIWAADAAQFGLVEAVVGITPLMGGTQRVAERAGPARARELVMTGGLYPAATLERWNVVNRVVAGDELEEKALRFAHRLAAGPTVAHGATKRLVRTATDHGPRAADAQIPAEAATLFASEDFAGAVESFLAEGPGKATFLGR